MIMTCRYVLPAVVLCLAFSRASLAADPHPSDRWEKDIQAFEAADRKSPPPKGGVLFIGASSVRRWKTLAEDFPDQQTINRGFGGSQLVDSAHFAGRIVLPYEPRIIILHAGSNDLNAGRSPEQVLAAFRAFVEKVHAALPETRIAFLSINPTPARWAQAERQQEANRLIREFVAGKERLDFIDLWDALLDADGQPRPELHVEDRLHANAEGYKIRAAIVREYLKSSDPAGKR